MKSLLLSLFAIPGVLAADDDGFVPLFNGRNLEGWEVRTGEEKWWTVADGVIRGGSLTEKVPRNTFLASTRRFENFELRLKVRLVRGDGFMNSGIQVRSIRVEGNHEMSGYQVDAGTGWWGKLYDESRRNRVIGEPLDPAALAAAARDWDWNDYRILCEGPRIRIWINGVAALDYTEEDAAIPLEGLLGLQCHGGGRLLVEFKDITLRELPPDKGAPAWPRADKLSPEAEQSSFVLPEGYEIELVASEEQGVPKPVTVAWDASGRMWTMTAVEYPVDANENQAQAEALYARGGRDKVLVFDNPSAPGPQTPRVFAEGLVIPLGLLPEDNAALVQYGTEIRRYIDDDRDGSADRFETVLEGFGIQDSHLFPHQFEHAPGGWVYVAQGLFNYSKVRRPGGKSFASGGKEIAYNQCKLARFRTDGSDFELLSAGPNNIWGFETDRDGEVFLQEANDMGIPVAEFLPGTHYATGSREKLRPYAPQIPESLEGRQMGGTGLSGIAIANDRGSAFASKYDGRRTFYIANPITNRIQVVTLSQDEHGRPSYRKEADFMTAGDTNFRPIAVRFGPDGFLYVVDWYNKIISHNEVPRTHPERDKTRGRIWRIKPKGATAPQIPDLRKADNSALLAALDHPSALVSRFAWLEIGRRGDKSMVPELAKIVGDSSSNLARRLNAFRALEEMGALNASLLYKWISDPSRHLRYEVVRAAGDHPSLDPAAFVQFIRPEETDFRVRAISADAVRRRKETAPQMTLALELLVPFVSPKSHGTTVREKYESDFLRYQIRWAFETHPEATRALLTRRNLPIEARALAILSLPAGPAALELAKILPTLGRSPNADEIALLGGEMKQPEVAKVFADLLAADSTRNATLQNLLAFDPAAASDESLRQAVSAAAGKLGPSDKDLVLALARKFRIAGLAPAIAGLAESGAIPRADALRTLREMEGIAASHFEPFLRDKDPAIQREAVIGYSASAGAAGVDTLAALWPGLPGVLRELALNGILRTPEGTAAFALAMADGKFPDAGSSAIERAITQLGMDHPAIGKLLASTEGLLMPVIHFPGKPDAQIPLDVTLSGPFTVESWVLMGAPLDNADSLLGRKGYTDFNFYKGTPILHSGGVNRITASRPIPTGVWTHVAFTRDAAGTLRIFIDGEPDPARADPFNADLTDLRPGIAIADGGTAGKFLGFRIWNTARSEDEIRNSCKTRFAGSDLPPGLVHNLPANDTPLVTMTADFPTLRTPAEADAIAAKFTAMKARASQPGDPSKGRALAEATCMICHQIQGKGLAIGPDLSGAGAMGIDALLRNILQPGEQLESGYYRHDVTLKDGTLVSGFLVSENPRQIVIRRIGADEQAIPRGRIASHHVSKQSLMPEGLIDGFSDAQIADLFAYLMSLK